MKKLYFVFDKLPNIKTGGLVATYVRLNELLKNEYDIKILSIFDYEDDCQIFTNNEKISVIKHKINLDFVHFLTYLKKFQLKEFIKDAFIYFGSIFKARRKIKKTISGEDLIIVSCPSAAIFMPKARKFILEIHIKFEFFWGKNIIGKLQSILMQKPSLILFRTKSDMNKAKEKNMTNVDYIYNFFDNENITKAKDIPLNKLCFVGRLDPQKDLPRMLKNALLLKKYNNDFILDIYGEGQEMASLKEFIKNNNLQNNVYLKGFTNDKEIYKNYSALWMTSKHEGFALVILEAKANGIPTISTVWGDGVYECIENNVDGYITNDDNEFVHLTNDLINNKEKLISMGNKAFENFNKFSKLEAKKKWLNILKSYKK